MTSDCTEAIEAVTIINISSAFDESTSSSDTLYEDALDFDIIVDQQPPPTRIGVWEMAVLVKIQEQDGIEPFWNTWIYNIQEIVNLTPTAKLKGINLAIRKEIKQMLHLSEKTRMLFMYVPRTMEGLVYSLCIVNTTGKLGPAK